MGGCRVRGIPDAGTPRDAGAPDAGTPPDAGPALDAGAPPDAGTPPPDAGTPPPDAGTPPDAGNPPDAGAPPPPQTGVLFSDDFNRTVTSGLGPRWTIVAGAWRDDNRANSALDTLDRAAAAGVSCSDCPIDATRRNFG